MNNTESNQPLTYRTIEDAGNGTLMSVHHFVQRDLEDQIEEEKQSKKSNTDMATSVKNIKISEVIALLNKGYTRYKFDSRNSIGSIQEFYDLKKTEVVKLFKDPKLKGKKVKSVPINVVDDTTAPKAKIKQVTETKAEQPATIAQPAIVEEPAPVKSQTETENEEIFN